MNRATCVVHLREEVIMIHEVTVTVIQEIYLQEAPLEFRAHALMMRYERQLKTVKLHPSHTVSLPTAPT